MYCMRVCMKQSGYNIVTSSVFRTEMKKNALNPLCITYKAICFAYETRISFLCLRAGVFSESRLSDEPLYILRFNAVVGVVFRS